MPIFRSWRPTLQRSGAQASSRFQHAILVHSQWRLCSSHGHPDTTAAPSEAPTNVAFSTHDHQTLGKRLNLFSTSPYSAGSPLLHADGSHLFLKLQSLLRAQHQAFGFREVVSPTIYKKSLWEKSGHWQNYSDDMFKIVGGEIHGNSQEQNAENDETWGLKPMNCPGHCLLFATETRSYRDLPIRYADFSPLHRNEVSGSLSGLTRVRRFHQDDGHIFCRPDQVKQEIAATLRMVNLIYSAFDLAPHKLLLSTRPETLFIGTASEWAAAEQQLETALNESGLDWSVNPGDGAFYGPKIDILLRDAHGKQYQTATIQLDFQLPQRFQLEYQTQSAGDTTTASSTTTETPILIHRAVCGSLERFLALLIEHYQGKWPLWLNPHQIAILPLNQTGPVLDHAKRVAEILSGVSSQQSDKLQPLRSAHFTVDVDSSSETQGRKLLHARNKGYGVVCVIGGKEVERGDVAATLSCVGDGARREKVKRVLEEVLPGVTDTEAWKEKNRLSLTPDVLKTLMERLCEEWL